MKTKLNPVYPQRSPRFSLVLIFANRAISLTIVFFVVFMPSWAMSLAAIHGCDPNSVQDILVVRDHPQMERVYARRIPADVIRHFSVFDKLPMRGNGKPVRSYVCSIKPKHPVSVAVFVSAPLNTTVGADGAFGIKSVDVFLCDAVHKTDKLILV